MSLIEQFIQRYGGMTEELKFYSGEITLRYDHKAHVYLLVLDDGTLQPVESVTTLVHIIDKSEALVPWSAKMMAQKLLATAEDFHHDDGRPAGPDNYRFSREELERWILDGKSAHEDHLEEAGNIGKLAHAWIEQYIKSVLSENETRRMELLAKLPEEERAANCCMAALEWMQRHNVRWINTERKIYSREFKFAGTLDGLCLVDSCVNPECCPQRFTNRLTIADWKTSNYLYVEYILQTAAYQHAYEEEFGPLVQDRWVIRLGKDDAEFDPWHLEGRELYEKDWMAFRRAMELYREVEEAEARIGAILTARKAVETARKRAEREAALKIKCTGADKYKGIRQPKCNQGHPCETCIAKYNANHPEKPLTIG